MADPKGGVANALEDENGRLKRMLADALSDLRRGALERRYQMIADAY